MSDSAYATCKDCGERVHINQYCQCGGNPHRLPDKELFARVEIISPQAMHMNAVQHGWYEAPPSIPEKLALVHSEVSEALEGYRNGVLEGEPGCLSEELADVVIRCFDLAAADGLDIIAAIERKHRKNIARPYKHGGKRC